MKITNDLLERAKTTRGGWTMRQMDFIGVKWPPMKGWKLRVLGVHITTGTAQRFVELGG